MSYNVTFHNIFSELNKDRLTRELSSPTLDFVTLTKLQMALRA